MSIERAFRKRFGESVTWGAVTRTQDDYGGVSYTYSDTSTTMILNQANQDDAKYFEGGIITTGDLIAISLDNCSLDDRITYGSVYYTVVGKTPIKLKGTTQAYKLLLRRIR